MKNGTVAFSGNNSGGITGGLTTGQDIVVRLAIKPTPTIAKPQKTIDKVALKDAELAAVTRRDPTIVSRVWPVAEGLHGNRAARPVHHQPRRPGNEKEI